jgi:hypothetical protein
VPGRAHRTCRGKHRNRLRRWTYAILADGTDNNGRRGCPVTETRATTPAFPPGRYGRRRDGRRRLLLPVLFGLVILAVTLALSVKLYRQYGDPAYEAQVIRYTGVTESQVTVDFTVRVPPGGSATCVLRARSYDGAEVGRRTVTVSAPAGDTQVQASEPVPTTARPFIGEVLRCRKPS